MNGWLELESDPGLFTLLVEDFGVEGVQVEEIYDLQKPFEGPIYGFIFLFRWMEERRARRKLSQDEESVVVDDKVINSMFFAQQVIPNSCATHALLSVLLNCENKVKLGSMLTQLKKFTSNMTPEDKGLAIGNMPDLSKAHNSHARREPSHIPEKQQAVSGGRTQETFHYVSFVHINGHLFELDGLKPYPIDHGVGRGDGEDWTEMFRRVITERLGIAAGIEPTNEIRFNLMAVVPDKELQYRQKLKTLRANQETLCNVLDKRMKAVAIASSSSSTSSSSSSSSSFSSSATTSTAAAAAAAATTATDEKPQKKMKLESCGSSMLTRSARRDAAAKNIIDCGQEFKGRSQTERSSSSASKSNDRKSKSSLDTTPIKSELIMDNSTVAMETVTPYDDLTSDVAMDVGGSNSSDGASIKKESGTSLDLDDVKMEDGLSYISLDDRSSLEDIIAEHDGRRCTGDKTLSNKELLSVLKKIEEEIETYKNAVKDEIEKKKKYKIDDRRRTHNYDEFICTFLTMLAEQGHLGNLVEQHLDTKKSKSSLSMNKLKNLNKKKKKTKKKR